MSAVVPRNVTAALRNGGIDLFMDTGTAVSGPFIQVFSG
jgi:hypothetical protein